MQQNAAQLIVDLGDLLRDRELPDIREATITLGDFGTIVPLSLLRKHFNSIKVGFVSSDKAYAFVNCKLSAESLVVFNARVNTAELKAVSTVTESFEVPAEEEEIPLPPIPIIEAQGEEHEVFTEPPSEETEPPEIPPESQDVQDSTVEPPTTVEEPVA